MCDCFPCFVIEAFCIDAGALEADADAQPAPADDVEAEGDGDGTTRPKRNWHRGKKRPAEPLTEAELAELALKRIRQRLASTPRSEINACMLLNEYRKGLNYELVGQTGPVHNPLHTVKLTVDEQVMDID